MGIDLGPIAIALILLLAPAIIVVTVFAIIYRRRGKVHRQRITKGSRGHHDKSREPSEEE
jgi:chromate transport protein ChrA